MGGLTLFPMENIIVDHRDEEAFIMPVVMIRRIMSGQMSIAECENPEAVAMALAALALSAIDGDDNWH